MMLRILSSFCIPMLCLKSLNSMCTFLLISFLCLEEMNTRMNNARSVEVENVNEVVPSQEPRNPQVLI